MAVVILKKRAEYKPTIIELTAVAVAFRVVVEKSDRIFKVGRCAASQLGALQHRDMYEGHESIEPIWHGSRQKAIWVEERLTRVAWRHFPQRCWNEQIGGGPSSEEEDEHCVYIVEWAPTIERLSDVFLKFVVRSLADDGEDEE